MNGTWGQAILRQLHWLDTSSWVLNSASMEWTCKQASLLLCKSSTFSTYPSTCSAVQFLCCISFHLDNIWGLWNCWRPLSITSCCPVQPFLGGPHPWRQTCLCKAQPTLGFVRQVLGTTKVGSFSIGRAHLWTATSHHVPLVHTEELIRGNDWTTKLPLILVWFITEPFFKILITSSLVKQWT